MDVVCPVASAMRVVMKMELVKSGADSESVLKVVIEREVIEVGSRWGRVRNPMKVVTKWESAGEGQAGF